MSRQNYYAKRRRRQKAEVDEGLMLELVGQERRLQPRIGGRKLLSMISPELEANDAAIGRDRFFDVLRKHELLVERKPAGPRTTNSRHSMPVFPNLAAELEVTGPDQLWVSDLTYIRTEQGFLYGAIIMDRHSRKIVGNHIGDSLEATGCLHALDQALAQLPEGASPMHHSDRGCQYCCRDYVQRLLDNGLSVSMTQIMHCYENSAAERVIGTIKHEFELDRCFRTKEQAINAWYQAIMLYNTRRPHLSLGYATPDEVHERKVA